MDTGALSAGAVERGLASVSSRRTVGALAGANAWRSSLETLR